MNKTTHAVAVPIARPVAGQSVDGSIIASCPAPMATDPYVATPSYPATAPYTTPAPAPTDRLAIASAVCGVTAVVPVFAQLAGLSLGVAGLMRIRRLRKRGVRCRGVGWAWLGIVSSGVALVGWMGSALMLSVVGSSMQGSLQALQGIPIP